MRKSIFFFLAIAAAASVSCVKEEANDYNDAEVNGVVMLQASSPADVTESGLTKTSMSLNADGETYSVLWSSDDAIKVNGTASSSVIVDADNGKKATFAVQNVAAPYRSVYPASVASDFDASSAVVTLPASQKYVAGTFDPSAAVMLGYSEDGEGLNFSHAMAYLKIAVSTVGNYDADAVKTVTVKSLGTEPMSGAFTATFAAEGCTLAPAASTASTSVTLDCGAAGVAKETPLVVAVPAGTYASGVVITVTDVNGHSKDLTAAQSLTLSAGCVYSVALRIAAPGIYNVAGYNAFAKAVNAGDYSDWVGEDGEVNLYADLTTDTDYVYIDDVEFNGTFDGNNHTMTSTSRSLPLFSTIGKDGVVKNLKLVSTFTTLTQFGEGAFSGFAKVNLGLIEGCSHTVSLEDEDFAEDGEFDLNAAGFAFGGFVWANGGTIQNSTMNGTIKVAFTPSASLGACYGGGFAALGHTVLQYQNASTINTDATCVPGKFINCENKADIKVQTGTNRTSRDGMGGICGLSYLDGVEFSKCKNSGKLERYRYISSTAQINNSMALGGILGQGASWYVGSVDAREARIADSGTGFKTMISECENAGEVILKARVASGNNGVNSDNNANRNLTVGGIVGAIVGHDASKMAEVSNCKNTGIASGASWSSDQYVISLGGIAGIASYTDLTGNIVSGTVKGADGNNGESILGAGGGIVGVAVNGVNISGGEVTGNLSLLFENSKTKITPRGGICLGIAMYKVAASSIKNVKIAPESYVITNKTTSPELTNPTLSKDNFESYLYSTFGSGTSLLEVSGCTWSE